MPALPPLARPAAQGLLPAIGGWLYGAYAWAVLALLVPVFALLATPLSMERGRRLAQAVARLMFRLVRVPLAVRGLERLPPGPHVLVVNHTSFLDAIVLTALLPATPGYSFVTRRQYRAQALLWPALRPLGTVVLAPPGAPKANNIERMKQALRRCGNLVIFPEGRIRREPGLLDFHSGAFVVAAAVGVPVVVAALRGTRRALPLGTWRLQREPIELVIGPALSSARFHARTAGMLEAAARRAMLGLCGEPDAVNN